ncbi:aminotransferase class I/II-fold pyridoxal phosphate-dependent enzyme [Rathayibacter iranicus]|nr:aminotransferase class I/II-fold pyridoxal phosphate-dependent enzyme [Rathayibacter iranicus]PWJ64018.1 cystathionine beta-lyase [Rathayibacter iranicus] [Rathayibacter iranicus NCPPB 2253 = VKM Ac-1602]
MSPVIRQGQERPLLRFRPARLKASEFEHGVLGAGSAELDYAPAQEISERLGSIVRRGQLGYALPEDLVELKHAAASWHRRTLSWAPQPEDFIAAPDIASAFAYFLLTMASADSRVLVPNPGYPKLKRVASALGFETLNYSVDRIQGGYAYSLSDIETHLRENRGCVVVLLHPHIPTGHLASKAELEKLATVVDKYRATVFSDEVHAPLWLEDEPHLPYAASSNLARQHTTTAVSTSKTWGVSGARVTQLIVPTDRRARHEQEKARRVLLEGAVTALGVQASIVAYDQGGPWLEALRARLRANRELVDRFVDQSSVIGDYVPPRSSFVAWMELAVNTSHESAAQLLLRRSRLGVLGAADFDSPRAGFFRLNFGSAPDVVERCLSLIADAGSEEDPQCEQTGISGCALDIDGSAHVKQQ